MSEPVSSAIRFNALKHHLGFLSETFNRWRNAEPSSILIDLYELGANQFDIYTGTLTVEQIIEQTSDILAETGITNKVSLKKWIGNAGYREVFLDDQSKWIIRIGADAVKYIHIHPARNQACVIRIKANHLKVAILVLLENQQPETENITNATNYINRIRKELIGLSPVRSLSESRKIIDTIGFLRNYL